MRSPEVSLARPVSIASRPSIAPLSRASSGEFRSFTPSVISTPKLSPVASIVRNPDIFNPRISINPGASKLGNSGGERKPFSFTNTKPLEAPKNTPMADRKIPGFSFKNTAVLASNKEALKKPTLKATPERPKLDSLFGPTLKAADLQPKGAERFGGMKTQLPSTPEVKIPWKPKAENALQISRNKTHVIAGEIAQRNQVLEQLPMLSMQSKEVQLKVRRPNPLVVTPLRGNERFKHLEQLPMALSRKPIKEVTASLVMVQTISKRIKQLEQLPIIPFQQKLPEVKIFNPEPKSGEPSLGLDPLANSLITKVHNLETIEKLPELQDNPIAKKVEVSVQGNATQRVNVEVRKAVMESPALQASVSPLQRELPVSTLATVAELIQRVPEMKGTPLSAQETQLQFQTKKQVEVIQALIKTPEFNQLLQDRQALKTAGFTVLQVDRLTKLRLKSQQFSTEQITEWLEQLEEEEDERAMKERESLLGTIVDEVKQEIGSQALVNGEDLIMKTPDEFSKPGIRSGILQGTRLRDGSWARTKQAILKTVKELPIAQAKRVVLGIHRQFRAVKRTSRATKPVRQEEVRQVFEDGKPVEVDIASQVS